MNTQIYDEASEWVVGHREGDLDAGARRCFDAWLRESPQHVRAYLEMSSIWESVPGVDPALSPGADELVARVRDEGNVHPFADVGARPSAARPSVGAHPRFFFSFAATLVLAVGVAGWLYLQRDFHATDVGEQRVIALSDGSSIELNAKSRLEVRYTAEARSVELLEGQAFFRVVKDPERPFVVESDGTLVRAVGTAFDVYQKSEDTLVTVVEGRVAVRASGADGAPPRADGAKEVLGGSGQDKKDRADEFLVVAGQQLFIARSASPVTRQVNVDAATAWTEQRLVFDFTPLTEVAEEFNRHNHRPLVIRDPGLRDFHVSGTFSTTDPTLLLHFLRDQPGIVLEETDGEIRVSRRKAGTG